MAFKNSREKNYRRPKNNRNRRFIFGETGHWSIKCIGFLNSTCGIDPKSAEKYMTVSIYTFSHCESASVHLRSADCIGVVSWDTTPAKVASYRHSAPLLGKGHWKSTQCTLLTLVTEFRLLNVHAEIECPCRNPLTPVEYEHTGSYSNEICRSAKRLSKFECRSRNELPHAAFSWEGADSQWEKV